MRYYRQHGITLVATAIESLAIGIAVVALSLMVDKSFLLALVLVAPAPLLWRMIRWYTFSVRVEGTVVTIRYLTGFVVHERVVSLRAPGGVRLRQNLMGWLLDYGTLRIEVFGEPVSVYYITSFRALQRQIDAA